MSLRKNNMKTIHLPKAFLLFSFLTLLATHSYSQKTQFSINAYSGVSYYRGDGALSTSAIITGYPFDYPPVPKPFTKNVYSKKITLVTLM